MTNLAEIKEAIEKLAPEGRAALREWLDESGSDTIGVIRERVRQIRAGEATLVDGDQVQRHFGEGQPPEAAVAGAGGGGSDIFALAGGTGGLRFLHYRIFGVQRWVTDPNKK